MGSLLVSTHGADMSDTPRPDDLVSVKEAAKMVDRGVSTVRSWVRSEQLTGYREDPNRSNSRLMVSTQDLMILAGTTKNPEPPRPGSVAKQEAEPPRDDSVMVKALVSAMEQTAETERKRAEEWRIRAEEWKLEAEQARAELAGARAELEALRAARGMSWWQRLIGTEPTQQIPQAK